MVTIQFIQVVESSNIIPSLRQIRQVIRRLCPWFRNILCSWSSNLFLNSANKTYPMASRAHQVANNIVSHLVILYGKRVPPRPSSWPVGNRESPCDITLAPILLLNSARLFSRLSSSFRRFA